MKLLALDGQPQKPLLTAPLPYRQQRSESAETPPMTSPRLSKMEESMPKSIDGGQLVFAVE